MDKASVANIPDTQEATFDFGAGGSGVSQHRFSTAVLRISFIHAPTAPAIANSQSEPSAVALKRATPISVAYADPDGVSRATNATCVAGR